MTELATPHFDENSAHHLAEFPRAGIIPAPNCTLIICTHASVSHLGRNFDFICGRASVLGRLGLRSRR